MYFKKKKLGWRVTKMLSLLGERGTFLSEHLVVNHKTRWQGFLDCFFQVTITFSQAHVTCLLGIMVYVRPFSSLVYVLVAKWQDINCFDRISGAIYGWEKDFCGKCLGQLNRCFTIWTDGRREIGRRRSLIPKHGLFLPYWTPGILFNTTWKDCLKKKKELVLRASWQ